MAGSPERCGKCGGLANDAIRHCPSCGLDLGAPNVRASRTPNEVTSLEARYAAEKEAATRCGCVAEFDAFERSVFERSSVVVTMPVVAATVLVADESNLYVNYEKLVGAGVRLPAKFANDTHRMAVAGSLFGSYGEAICYGALALGEAGLPTYGEIDCRLKPVAIDERVSFLEWNSYTFVREKKKLPTDPFPCGHRADWQGRSRLAVTKLGSLLRNGQTQEDREKMLIITDGKNRASDDFIEAHIYDGFNLFSIESMTPAADVPKDARTAVKMAIGAFHKFLARSS